MKLGVMGAGLASMGWEKALDYCQKVGLDAIELPVGAYPGKPFFDPEEVLGDPAAQQKIRDDVAKRGLEIIGLAVHGNPVSPDRELAARHADRSLGLVDAAVAACAEAYGGRVLTLDRRDFAPLAADLGLTLLP